MKKKNILKGASVLLVATLVVVSTGTVIANTTIMKEETPTFPINCGNQVIIEKRNQEITSFEQNTNGVLWDNGLPDGFAGLGCVYQPGVYDWYIVDDFDVPNPGWIVDDGHFRMITQHVGGPDAIDVVDVYIFEDTGDYPAMTHLYFDSPQFDAYLTGNTYFGRPEIAVDVDMSPVTLDSGKYWVCFQPQVNAKCFWLSTPGYGNSVYVDQADIGYPRWTDSNTAFGGWYDVSFQLTGEIRKAELEIDNIAGGFGVNALINNIGSITAENVVWEIEFEGGFIFSPTGGVATGGPFDIPSATDQAISAMAFGFGGFILPLNIILIVNSDNADTVNKTVPAKLLLIFVDI